MTEERTSTCVYCLNFRELLDVSFESWWVNCFLGCRGRNASKQTVGSNDFSSCFIKSILIKISLCCFLNQWWASSLLFCNDWYFCTDTVCVNPVPHCSSLALFHTAWLFWGWKGPCSLWCHQRRDALCEASGISLRAYNTRVVLWADLIQRVHVVLIL